MVGIKGNKGLFKRKMRSVYLISILVYFLQGIKGITAQPLMFYFKETLGLGASAVMLLASLTSVFWLVKPLYGIMIDKYPIFGYRHKAYILLSLFLSILSALMLGVWSLPLVGIVLMSMFDSFAGAVRDVATDGLSVEIGNQEGINDKLQTLQWGSLTVAGILTGIIGGYISEHFSYKVAFLVLTLFYLPLIFIVLGLKEKKITESPKLNIKELWQNKQLVLGALFLLALWFSPAIGTPIMYKIRDDLAFSKMTIGLLGSLGSVMAVIGSILYWKLNKKVKLKQLLYVVILLSAISTFAYLWLNTILVWVYTIIFGITGMIGHLTLMTYMANITPKNYESTVFALLCSIVNFGAFMSGFVGSFLYKFVGYNGLIIISGMFTLICLAFIPYLKIGEKDGMSIL